VSPYIAPRTSGEMIERLRRHYIKPGDPFAGGAFLTEVALGDRRADALYVGFASSRGEHLIGHEVKVSRSDWLHELDQPEKAEKWATECHAWYVVAPSTAIVHVAEVPHGWGLMVPNSRTRTRLDIVKAAEIHLDRRPSWAATHAIIKKQDTIRAQLVGEESRKVDAKHRGAILRLEQRVRELEAAALTDQRAARGALAIEEALGAKVSAPGYGDPALVFPDGSPLNSRELVATLATFLATTATERNELASWRIRDLTHTAESLRAAADAAEKAAEVLR